MKYSKQELGDVIRQRLEDDRKSGVPLDGTIEMLSSWVADIARDEVSDAVTQMRNDLERAYQKIAFLEGNDDESPETEGT